MKKVVVLLAEGFEEIEALSVVDILRRAEVQVDMCSIKDEFVTGGNGIVVKADITLDAMDARQYDGIVLPGGGLGTENLKNSVKVIELVKDFYKSGRLTAAMCAAPTVLAEAGIVDGHNITSYPDVKEQLKNAVYKEEITVVDSNIVTSRGPGTSMAFGYEILNYLGLSEVSSMLQEGMMYNFLTSKVCEK